MHLDGLGSGFEERRKNHQNTDAGRRRVLVMVIFGSRRFSTSQDKLTTITRGQSDMFMVCRPHSCYNEIRGHVAARVVAFAYCYKVFQPQLLKPLSATTTTTINVCRAYLESLAPRASFDVSKRSLIFFIKL